MLKLDATTMHFYLDGEFAHTMTFSTEVEPTPFDKPLFLNAVCATYAWEHPPEIRRLKDRRKNTARYDYIRTFTLEKAGGA